MQIHQAINNIMAEIPAIGKDRKNAQQGFAYRGIDDVMNALNPIMTKHKVFCAPTVLSLERTEGTTKQGGVMHYVTATVKYTFYADDGSSVEVTVAGEGMDSADKATNKALAGAMKYAMFQLFCIPTEDGKGMTDPDATTPEEVMGCADCHKPITGIKLPGGKTMTAAEVMGKAVENYGKPLCFDCMRDARATMGKPPQES